MINLLTIRRADRLRLARSLIGGRQTLAISLANAFTTVPVLGLAILATAGLEPARGDCKGGSDNEH